MSGLREWFEKHRDIEFLLYAIGSLIFLYVVAIYCSPLEAPYKATPMQNISIFAIFYLIAQLTERVTYLFSNVLGGRNPQKVDKNKSRIEFLKSAIDKTIENNKENLSKDYLDSQPIKGMIGELNDLNDKNNHESTERAIRLWLFASLIGVLFTSHSVGLFEIIGVKLVPHPLDSFFSGIIIGGGTKPLHDIISYIENKKG
jgi:hypothetical protein